MGCLAQVRPVGIEVDCSNPGCPPFCDDKDCVITIKEINCCIIRGTVTCENGGAIVPGVIVFATGPVSSSSPTTYAGITNENGQYSICVPGTGTYQVECYCCQDDCCDLTTCECGCNGD
jgi:hypothetical protein